MKNFRGRINADGGEDFLIEDSDSELSDSEVEAVFPNMLIINQQDLLADGDDDDDSSIHGDTSDEDDEQDIIVPIDDEGEDVSMEGFYAFGGRARTRSLDDANNLHQEEPPTAAIADSSGGSSSRAGQSSSALPLPLVFAAEQVEEIEYVSSSNSTPIIILPSRLRRLTSYNEQDSEDQNREGSTCNNNESLENVCLNPPPPQSDCVVLDVENSKKETDSPKNADLNYKDVEDSKSCLDGSETGDVTDETKTEGSHEIADDEEVTCNPMVSDVEELEENEDAFRGDRIGGTTYSQRHVLKLLIKWVQELPKYSSNESKEEEDKIDGDSSVDKTKFLEDDFEEEMSLLWDMSFEPDVMSFLVENNVFNMIRETLDVSSCARLSEISLGILANTLSQQNIAEDFCIHDASLKLVEVVVSQAIKMPSVPVLIQLFAVLRRITWFLRSVAPLQKWLDLLLSQEFLGCANFIMSSSTNAVLLGNVIVCMFTLLETISTECEEKEENEQKKQSSHNYFGKALTEKPKDFEKYRPFCETAFMPSLCEGLNELMKKPKPRKTQQMTSTRDKVPLPSVCGGTEERALEDDMDLPMPDGLVQNAILNGLVAMFYLHKTTNGKEVLRQNLSALLDYLVNFFRKFSSYTETVTGSSRLDYFALAVNLITFCHKEVSSGVMQEDFIVPVSTASKLMENEGREDEVRICVNEGQEQDSITFIALVIHEYLASLGEAFGQNELLSFKNTHKKYSKFFETVDKLVCRMSDDA